MIELTAGYNSTFERHKKNERERQPKKKNKEKKMRALPKKTEASGQSQTPVNLVSTSDSFSFDVL